MLSQRLLARADAPARGARDVSPLVVTLHLPELTVVDVREPHELSGELGHIPVAVNVPLGGLIRAASAWDRAAPLLLVCRSGARSSRGAQALGDLGFTALFNLAGGMLAWDANGLPRARDPQDTTQRLLAILGLAFVAACDGEVEPGARALHEVMHPAGTRSPGGLPARLAVAVAAFDARAPSHDDPTWGYTRMLREALDGVTRAR
jgi:rhodanese-related sulfurtransferase